MSIILVDPIKTFLHETALVSDRQGNLKLLAKAMLIAGMISARATRIYKLSLLEGVSARYKAFLDNGATVEVVLYTKMDVIDMRYEHGTAFGPFRGQVDQYVDDVNILGWYRDCLALSLEKIKP